MPNLAAYEWTTSEKCHLTTLGIDVISVAGHMESKCFPPVPESRHCEAQPGMSVSR
jgi:hypothetical protein